MRIIAMVGAALALVGCRDTLPTALPPGQLVTVRGELTAGVECPMLVTKEDRRFSVVGDLGGFKLGDRVCVRGTIAEVSFCMAGEATISITAIGPGTSCP